MIVILCIKSLGTYSYNNNSKITKNSQNSGVIPNDQATLGPSATAGGAGNPFCQRHRRMVLVHPLRTPAPGWGKTWRRHGDSTTPVRTRRHQRCDHIALPKKIIGQEHLKVLAIYGWNDCAPDPRLPDEERAAFLWDDALDRLTTELEAKGIVATIVGGIAQ